MNSKANFNNFKAFGDWYNEGQKINPSMDNNPVNQNNHCPICDMSHTTKSCSQTSTDSEDK